MNKIQIGLKIREQRIAKSLTLRQLAEATGISHSFISDIERDRSRPSYENLVKIAKVLNIPISNFFD